jgi:phosphate transport system substrate-binding protein
MNGCCRWRQAADALLLVLVVTAGLVLTLSCGTTPRGDREIVVAGSDTMLPLNRRLAEGYMRGHPGIAVRVSGGGTGRGVEQLLDGAIDLCAASRPFRPDEIEALNRTFGTIGLRYLIARDALSVYVHPSNPVQSLSLAELAGLFSGAVTDWSDVGGAELPVRVVIRPPSSGTHHFFRDHVLGGADYTPTAEVASRVGDVIARVAADPGAVGYGDLAHDGAVDHLLLDGVAPSADTVRRGEYPLARYLYYYSVAPAEGARRDYVEWCLGPDGQRVVEQVGFIAPWIDD